MSDKLARPAPSALTTIDPIDALVQKAVESGAVDVLERLLAVKQQVRADDARAAFYAALIGFQNACPVIEKTTTANIKPGFSYNYTPLEVIAHAIRPMLDQYQLGYRWFAAQQGNLLTVTCRISHAHGHIEETSLTVPVGVDPQRPAWPVAQSLTYAKRYTLCNALGIVVGGEDDDAHESRPTTAQPAANRQELSKAPPAPPVASASPPQDDDSPAIVTIANVTVKTGKTGDKEWTRYSITTEAGVIYSTFDKTLAERAKEVKGYEVALSWERSGKYLNCTGIEPTEHGPIVVEPEGADLAQGWEPGMDA